MTATEASPKPNRAWRRRLRMARNTGKPPTIPGTVLLSTLLTAVTCEPIHEILGQAHPNHYCGGYVYVNGLEGPRRMNVGERVTVRERTNRDGTVTIWATIYNEASR